MLLHHDGLVSQEIIVNLMNNLEAETQRESIRQGVATNMLIVLAELSQNIMNYSKNATQGCTEVIQNGLICVSKENNSDYCFNTQNILSKSDKEKIQPKLLDITTMDKKNIKKRYKELRKSGENTHSKGGGLGFYEIAKRVDDISYNFTSINEDKYYFELRTKIKSKKDTIV